MCVGWVCGISFFHLCIPNEPEISEKVEWAVVARDYVDDLARKTDEGSGELL